MIVVPTTAGTVSLRQGAWPIEVIYRIMELLDGYGGELQRCNIVNNVTGEVINEGLELHDICVEFLEDPFRVQPCKQTDNKA